MIPNEPPNSLSGHFNNVGPHHPTVLCASTLTLPQMTEWQRFSESFCSGSVSLQPVCNLGKAADYHMNHMDHLSHSDHPGLFVCSIS